MSRGLLNVGDLATWSGIATAYVADFQVRTWADKWFGCRAGPGRMMGLDRNPGKMVKTTEMEKNSGSYGDVHQSNTYQILMIGVDPHPNHGYDMVVPYYKGIMSVYRCVYDDQ